MFSVGLGKTIQTISLFSLLQQRGEVKKPHLIIVPATGIYYYYYYSFAILSLGFVFQYTNLVLSSIFMLLIILIALENWVREFTVWSPSLRVAMYHGSLKEREALRYVSLHRSIHSHLSNLSFVDYFAFLLLLLSSVCYYYH